MTKEKFVAMLEEMKANYYETEPDENGNISVFVCSKIEGCLEFVFTENGEGVEVW